MRKPSTHKKVNIKPEFRPFIDHAIARAAVIPINRDFDIPYLAGYSNDGSTIYIDRHMPDHMTFKGKRFNTDRLLAVHECTEKLLEDHFHLKYQDAHAIATYTEQEVVSAAGIPWVDYNHFMNKYVKEMDSERITEAPPDLDLKPYIDEGDMKHIPRLKRAMAFASRTL